MTDSNAIVCLTRGYPNVRGYHHLIERNRAIYEIINRNRTRQYPLILWHEGNIPAEHQRYIAGQDPNEDLRFVDVSRVFRLPMSLRERDLVGGGTVGYRLMCRFHSYYIWQYTRQFDYVMRLDEDCTLISAAGDPIALLADAQGDFATAVFTKESHQLTNHTLPVFVQSFIEATQADTQFSPYNQDFPYTNLYVTRTAFWRQANVQQFLDAVRRERDSLRLRWGDLPVLGVALNMFAAPEKVYRLSGIGYRHGSHNWTIAAES
jgi:Glycolipid 2-alpha-mannosyltransferase